MRLEPHAGSRPIDRKTIIEECIARVQAAHGLAAFARYTHPAWQEAKHHAAICGLLERVESGEVRRAIIEAPPRHGKSELVSRRFPAWYLGRNPEREIISTAYGADLAIDEYGRKVRNIVRDPLFANIFPGIELAEDSQAAGRWNTNKGGGYLSTGVGGGITGRGANLLLIDDPFAGRAEADSERERYKVWSWYDSEARTRLAPGGAIVIINTRWHEEDLAGMVLKHHAEDNWEVLKMPAIANEGTDHEMALWPERFDLEYLRALRESYMRSHPREWYALYQQSPRAEQGTYIQRAWFNERYDAKPKEMHVYMASDFATTEAREGKDPDYTSHGVFGLGPEGPPDEDGKREPGKIYVLDWYSAQVTSDVWVAELLRLIGKWKPACWFGEAGVIGNAMRPSILKGMRQGRMYSRTEWLSPIHDKATRGRSFQGMAHAGLVLFPREEWAERVINQCVSFPGGAHDDDFDVLAWMCLAIDQAHPAISVVPPVPKKKHDYDRKEPVGDDAWKHA